MTQRGDLRHVLELALPVIVAELGWMFMTVVDTIMVGPLGPTAIGAVSVGNALFDVAAVGGIGVLLGLDTVVSQAWGGRRLRECDEWLWQGTFLALAATVPLMLAVALSEPLLQLAGVKGDVIAETLPYTRALNWSLPPLLLYAAFRRYLQSIGHARPVMFALISANIVNAVGNYVLVGRYGVEGVGWSTCVSRVWMAAALIIFTFAREPAMLRTIPRPDLSRLRELLRLGLPAAGHILLEVGVFAGATTLAGRLAAEQLAAHHIVLNIAGTTFMVPLGMSSAAAVVVGQAIGAGEHARARRLGWTTIALAAAFMSLMALSMLLFPQYILGMFRTGEAVYAVATHILFAAALFQIFDGIQVTTTGVLRGAGNTRTPMIANLMGHWLMGLPAGYLLCFTLGWGVPGLWIGFSTGLTIVALWLLFVWSRTPV